jgi:hypothetical protein
MQSVSCKIPVGLSQALREAGISESAVLARAGLPPRLLADRIHHVSPSEYFALWQAIRDVSRNPNVGIQLATLVRPDVTEPLFLAILSAADVAEALRVVAAFKRLLEPEDLHILSDPGGRYVEVIYDWPDLDERPPQALTDAELAFLVHVCRKGTGDGSLAPHEIRLRARALERGATHAKFFGCPIVRHLQPRADGRTPSIPSRADAAEPALHRGSGPRGARGAPARQAPHHRERRPHPRHERTKAAAIAA